MAKKKPAKSKKLATGRRAVHKTAAKPVRRNPRKGARVVASKKKRPAAAPKEPIAKAPVVKARAEKSVPDKSANSKPSVTKVPIAKVPVAKVLPAQSAISKPAVAQPLVAKPPLEAGSSPGRPKITGDEDLEQFFKEDNHAKQICRFLNVQTLKDLERYSASEILRRLTNPMKETVEKIRRSLAQHQRCLAGDESYLVQQQEIAAKQAKSN